MNATYHFTFTGDEEQQATVVIHEKEISTQEGHHGEPDLHITADTKTWLGFLSNEKNIVWAILRRKVRLREPLKLLLAFGKCFPAKFQEVKVDEILPPIAVKLTGEAVAWSDSE